MTNGKAYFANPNNLSQFVLIDFLRRRKAASNRYARRLAFQPRSGFGLQPNVAASATLE